MIVPPTTGVASSDILSFGPALTTPATSPFPVTSVMALTNGNVFYVADREAFFDGSQIYGTECMMPEMAAPGTDRVLADAALRALRAAYRQSHGGADE